VTPVTIPEPSSLALLTLAVTALLPRRRAREIKPCAATAALLCVGIALAAPPAPAATPAIFNLGTLGGNNSYGYAVNDAGQVAGYSSTSGNTSRHAFRYDGTPGAGGVMRDLGTLGGIESEAYGVNNAAQVAGYSYDFQGAIHAFRYDGTPGTGGVMRDLGTLGGINSYGYAVNTAGQVAGYSEFTFGEFDPRAFRYDGTPGNGGVMRDLGTLGGTYSSGWAINEAHQVAGHSYVTGDSALHVFRYDGTPGAGGIMRDLGTLGGTLSNAWAINDLGQIVGRSQITGSGTFHAFLYTGTPGAGGQMIDLDIWLNTNNPTEGPKWTLSQAYGVSNTGWITGAGTYDPDGPGGAAAVDRAYLLDASGLVPEPGSLALLALGGLAILLRRRREQIRVVRYAREERF
jgi:probable HAF family extracellular repeat protein